MNGTSLTTAFVPLPGGGTAVYNASGLAGYRHADWLGSSRLTSTQSRGLDSSTAYAPFGEQYAASGTADPSFTGQNSDTVPSLYDFTFRRLSPSQGRWISPDPSGIAAVDPTNPQSMNRYAYVANNPLSYIDPTGLNLVSCFLFGIGCDDGGGGGGAGAGGGGGPDPCGGNYDTCVSVYGGDPNSCSMTDPMCQWAYGSASGGGVPNVPNGGTFGGGGRAPNNTILNTVCSVIPSGRTVGVSGGVGGVGSVGGGGEIVLNYNSGQVSAFGFGGVQVGWNGGASGSIYTGFVYGLNDSNSNYSGGFTGVNGGAGLGGFAASSSGGLTGGISGLAPNGQVKAMGISLGGGLLGGFSGGVTATNYSNPAQLGNFWAFTPLDDLIYEARQVLCK